MATRLKRLVRGRRLTGRIVLGRWLLQVTTMPPSRSELAIVTGASSRIGRAIAEMLSRTGHHLALFGRDRDRLEDTRRACAQAGVEVRTYAFDLASDTETSSAVARVLDQQGKPRVLVHAAGLFDWAAPEQADRTTWGRLVEVNLTAAMRLTHMLVPTLVGQDRSAVVFIASGAGHQGFANNAAYVASKHGLVGFGRALFLDLRDKGTKVSVISPGLVAAGAALGLDERLLHRFLQPDDVADAVHYVLSTAPRACPTEIHLQPQQTPLDD